MSRRRVTVTVIAVLAALALIVSVALTGRQLSGSALSESPTPTPAATGSTEAGIDPPRSGAPDPIPPRTGGPSPLLVAPLPATASAEGALTSGFPSRVVPLAPDSRVVTSSLAAEGTRLQVALAATSGTPAAGVIDHYRSTYDPLGFSGRPVDGVSGSTAWVFTRGDNSVTVSVSPLDAGSAYTVFGTFVAGD